ncbi:MAG TPA: aldehyde dehydrogenase family protein [Solirubrobacteraceae bacterium]|jgi:phenylacetaldehyde dehydrogenase|nr:aldehyde dehydrogenase family protein [Solirubrobacteraceae bacterium]
MAITTVSSHPQWLSGPMRMLIGEDWVQAGSGESLIDIDPATCEPLAEVPAGDAADIDAAVGAARQARAGWAGASPDRRSRVLWRMSELVEQHADELALLDTLDSGKPLLSARGIDLPAAAQMLRYWAGWPTKIEGATIPISTPGSYQSYTLCEPVGVVGVIVPWNAPALFVAWKVGAALACGNTVVLKPAEETPLSALRLAELGLEAGLPAGALNVVTGFGETAGAALAAHPDVDKVAFTGSVETGRRVVGSALGNLKKVSLELGGKSPNIIFSDADLASAIPGAASAIFFNQGCVCAAGSRLFVHESVFDEVIAGVIAAAERIRLGPGIDPHTRMGPLVSEAQRDRVSGLVRSGVEAGARPVTGGRCREGPGFFYEPTVLLDVEPDMRVVREEIFGPVVVAEPFGEVEEVIAKANDTAYGLAAGVWTRELATVHALAMRIRAGTVWVNTYNVVDPALPFGGVRQSGWGRDLGRAALDLYTETKAVCIRVG